MKIYLVCPPLPPRLDGIGDYTALLASELANSHTVTILTSEKNATTIPNVCIKSCFSTYNPKSYWGICDAIAEDVPDWIILQYNPFSYGKRGMNLELPRVMDAVRKRFVGTRFALMVHEPFMPFESWKSSIMTTWQRWQLWSLGNSADVTFYSWRNRFQRWFPGKPAVHLPVGSNIPFSGVSREQAREHLGIPKSTLVLGFFGQAHHTRMFNSMYEASLSLQKAGNMVQILCIGSGGDQVRSSFGDLPTIITGRLDAPDVSKHLSAIDIYLSVFKDGISTRRGSMMDGIQHALPTVGTIGPYTDTLLQRENNNAYLLSPVGDQQAFNDAVLQVGAEPGLRAALSTNAAALYEREFTWARITNRLTAALG